MSLYIVEDDDANVLDNFGEFNNSMINATLYDEPLEPERDADEYGGHVVELVDKPTPVVVSVEEAEMLEKAKHNPTLRPSFMITEYSNSHNGYILGNDLEDRLMCAYVNGWVVEKPKRYLIKVPHTDDSYFYKIDDEYCNAGDSYHLEGMTDKKWFTAAEIEHYGLHDCERVEVTDDEQ